MGAGRLYSHKIQEHRREKTVVPSSAGELKLGEMRGKSREDANVFAEMLLRARAVIASPAGCTGDKHSARRVYRRACHRLDRHNAKSEFRPASDNADRHNGNSARRVT